MLPTPLELLLLHGVKRREVHHVLIWGRCRLEARLESTRSTLLQRNEANHSILELSPVTFANYCIVRVIQEEKGVLGDGTVRWVRISGRSRPTAVAVMSYHIFT